MKTLTIGPTTFTIIRQSPDKLLLQDPDGDRFIVLRVRLRNMGAL